MSIGTVERTSPGFRLVGWVAVCTCGSMVLRFGTLKDIVFDITRRGWEYRNRVWRCGACARKEGVE